MAETQAAPASAAKEKQKRQLPPNRIQGREFVMTDHCATVEEGTTLEEVQDPAFWAHVAPRLKPYDEITVRTDDGLWWAKLLVLVAGRTFAKVKVLQAVQLTTADVDQSGADKIEGFSVKYRGPLCKFSVIREQDQKLLSEGHDTRAAADAWLAEHLKASK